MDSNTNGGNFTVLIPNVILSYFNGFQPLIGKNDQGQETRNYCTHGIMDPAHPAVQLIKDAQRKAAAFKWGDQATAVLTQLAAANKLALRSGDAKGGEEYTGKVFISANSKVRPRIVVSRGGVNVEIGENDPCAPYSGAKGNLIVDIWPQQHPKFGKRINAQWTGVQFVEHGKRFGGGRIARVDEFGIVPTDADGAVPGAPLSNGADSAASLI